LGVEVKVGVEVMVGVELIGGVIVIAGRRVDVRVGSGKVVTPGGGRVRTMAAEGRIGTAVGAGAEDRLQAANRAARQKSPLTQANPGI